MLRYTDVYISIIRGRELHGKLAFFLLKIRFKSILNIEILLIFQIPAEKTFLGAHGHKKSGEPVFAAFVRFGSIYVSVLVHYNFINIFYVFFFSHLQTLALRCD